MQLEIKTIDNRYSNLAESDCCLSCGGSSEFAEVQLGDKVVDLGSGRGIEALKLAEKVGEHGFIYGIDIAQGMIDKAKKEASKLEITNVDFLLAELPIIPLPDDSIDWVISNCVINHVKDKLKLWQEVHRILKPGGKFVVSDIYSSVPVPEKYANDVDAIAECWGGAVTKQEYWQQLNVAGFVTLNILEESKPYSKGEIEVSSFTILGTKKAKSCCCCN